MDGLGVLRGGFDHSGLDVGTERTETQGTHMGRRERCVCGVPTYIKQDPCFKDNTRHATCHLWSSVLYRESYIMNRIYLIIDYRPSTQEWDYILLSHVFIYFRQVGPNPFLFVSAQELPCAQESGYLCQEIP